MGALILSGGAPKGISLAPRLRPALTFQEITPAFVSFKTLLGIIYVKNGVLIFVGGLKWPQETEPLHSMGFWVMASLSQSRCALVDQEVRNCPKARTPEPHFSKLEWGSGGGSGIRTHGYLRITRFRIERLKPGSAIPPGSGKLAKDSVWSRNAGKKKPGALGASQVWK